MQTHVNSDKLMTGETIATHANVTAMHRYRSGRPDRPLIVFVPGGGHLGRIVYGHEGSTRQDFLDFWLEQEGCGLLAASYPSGHPALNSHQSDLTIREWTDWIAQTISNAIGSNRERRIIIALWSMAGRSAHALNEALIRTGILSVSFISLAATPPIPELIPLPEGGEYLGKSGFWMMVPPTGLPRHKFVDQFETEIAAQSKMAGHEIFTLQDFHQHYLCNTPIMLRGTAQRYHNGTMSFSQAAANKDMGSTYDHNLPLTGTIIPRDFLDLAHVLGDRASWGHLNTQRFIEQIIRLGVSPSENWPKICDFVAHLQQRLSIVVPGGHFFFLGEPGAKQTAEHILSLDRAIADAEQEFLNLLKEQ